MKRSIFTLFSILIAMSMLLSACQFGRPYQGAGCHRRDLASI